MCKRQRMNHGSPMNMGFSCYIMWMMGACEPLICNIYLPCYASAFILFLCWKWEYRISTVEVEVQKIYLYISLGIIIIIMLWSIDYFYLRIATPSISENFLLILDFWIDLYFMLKQRFDIVLLSVCSSWTILFTSFFSPSFFPLQWKRFWRRWKG